MARDIKDIGFDALRNAIYHTSRRGFLDLLNRCMNFVVVAAGASAVADLGVLLGLGLEQKILVAISALAGLLQLVFDFAGSARTHEYLQRRFYEIVAEISESKAPNDDDLARWDATLSRLYAEEKPPMRALDAIAFNAAAASLGIDASKRIRVRWWHSVFRQVWPFNEAAF